VVTHIVPEVFAYITRSQRVGEEQLADEPNAHFATLIAF